MARFIFEKVIYRYSIISELIVNRGIKNIKKVITETKRYYIRRKVTSVYNLRANGLLEVRYIPLVKIISIYMIKATVISQYCY